MKKAALHFIRRSRFIFRFALLLTALAVIDLIFASCARNLTGTYKADDGGVYYMEQSGSTLWWAGLSLDRQLPADYVWHRGLEFTNVFRGTINNDNTIVGEWSDLSRGATLNSGTLTVKIDSSGGVTKLTKLTATGGFGATSWTKTDPLDDTKFNGATLDIISRFDAVHKNDGQALHENNLKPYRDATVVYGRLVTQHLDYLDDNKVEAEVPHVNYGADFSPPIPNGNGTYQDFGHGDRDFTTFACSNPDGDGNKDADFDLRVKIDLDKLEPDFYTTGWGDRTRGPQVFSLKLNDANTRQKLNYARNEAYMGLEAIMVGKPGTCDSLQDGTYGFASLLPGWADLFSASVLVNGRPINGNLPDPQHGATCDFIQPCPRFDRLGIQVGNLSLVEGTYVRVTGVLVLDCGHATEWGLDHPCFDDDPEGDPDDISSHSNQEIHPMYSIDVINFPYRPEDINISGWTDLSGTYGGSDGSTYYVRQTGGTNIHQPGRTIWWLGLMRDRQPIQRGTDFPIIGSKQLKPAFDANDPPCASGQCWAFATVFRGTITESPTETVIEGDWAGIPQSTSNGSSGGHMKFFVFKHKIIIPATASIFPVTIEKMYDGPETGGTKTQGN